MAGYLLDTNHLSAALRPGNTVRSRIGELQRGGFRVGTCVPVLCELEAGIALTSHPDENRRIAGRLLAHLRVWPLDPEIAVCYGELYRHLRQQGRVLSQVDIMLSAVALQHRVTLVTADRDFDAIPRLRTESWV